MRVAALYDVHGNRPALDAVLAAVDAADVDVVLFGGDLVLGPFPRETIDRVRAIAGARFVLGNADEHDPAYPASAWAFARLTDEDLGFVRGFEQWIVLDGVRYRHGSPALPDEVVKPLTPRQPLL